jgi:hypothetical protein
VKSIAAVGCEAKMRIKTGRTTQASGMELLEKAVFCSFSPFLLPSLPSVKSFFIKRQQWKKPQEFSPANRLILASQLFFASQYVAI